MERAVAAAESADSRERTEHEYEHRVRAKSSAAPTASLWKGWMRLHHPWYGTGEATMPVSLVTLGSIRAVMAFSSLEDTGTLAWNM